MTRRVPCIMCTGTDYASDCANGQCGAQQLDLTEHPVDVLKDYTERMGFPPMSEEAEAEARRICDELVEAPKLPHMAALMRKATDGRWFA